ncbi:MAG: EVE domain-containing protein, partial [Bacteroidota bacterium]
MAYWLLKSEPETYAWGDLIREKIGTWDGVRNHQAKLNLKSMVPGDQALFY